MVTESIKCKQLKKQRQFSVRRFDISTFSHSEKLAWTLNDFCNAGFKNVNFARFLLNILLLCCFIISLGGVPVAAVNSTDTDEVFTNDSSHGFHIGDNCIDRCSQVIPNSFCNESSHICQCQESHPIVIEGVACVKSRSLHETCTYDKQCRSYDLDSLCLKLSNEEASVCSCKPGFYADKEHNIPIKFRCFPDSQASFAQTSVPTIVGLAICLTILSFLLCFMFKLFSRSRWARARGYADANDAPPTIVLEGNGGDGTAIDIEKQLYQLEELEPLNPSPPPNTTVQHTAINITCPSPSPSILKAGSVSYRRGSGNNNSNYAAPISGAASRRSSGNVSFSAGFNSRRTSLQRNGLTVSGTDLKESTTSSRRSSAFNNTSGTAPTSGTPSRRSSSNVSIRSRSGSRKASVAKNGLTADLIKALRELESGEGDIEQRITIVPNPRAKRRGSMANYAFPELHSSRAKSKQEPENLLILTRTRTDRHGRRHSVAVPLIPPPDGEKFEGGYHVERNPITGGATLVPPESHFVRGRSSSERRRSVREPSISSPRPSTANLAVTAREQMLQNKQSKKDMLSKSFRSRPWPAARTFATVPSLRRSRNRSSGMPTIGEQNHHQNQQYLTPDPTRSKSLYIRRRQDSSLTAEPSLSKISLPGRVEKKNVVISTNVPAADGRRRHSYQSGGAGTSALSRDLERLKVSEPGATPQTPRTGISPRPSTKKRKPSSRRSSRSGFLHFLDLAIAN